MPDSRRRRRVLASIGTGTVAMVAGCLGGGEDDPAGGDGRDDSVGAGDGGSPPDDLTAADVLAEDEVDGFVADFEVGAEAPISGTQVAHDGDFYLEETESGVERYAIGEELYVVHGGQCFVEDRGDPDSMDDAYVAAEPARGAPLDGVPISDVTTIDGEEVYVIEVDELHTTYVSTDTGYRVREEWGESGVADFHSWGETEPISPPDVDCRE